ncbi:hypothetical protein HYH02_001225 [Chlamydomonas schloesseri]|uniref:Galactose oxidase-like Early set domain-containing protein n=1 Tax=Chlamydomonas schloesseri TaxID=2026947 RepID=A0A836BCZ2_9CHLO|nr:hypothetical protein HYH02_001225 [Chlamydomonas schloesseri]|eukprot:KAG2454190.1 hypothetical protein HYH02_001225 [Chlamydomonas schloesseri]
MIQVPKTRKPLITETGQPVFVGGETRNSGSRPPNAEARNLFVGYNAAKNTYTRLGSMYSYRWYPSTLKLQDGKVLVVGGSTNIEAGPALEYAELWDSRNPAAPTVNVTHPDNYKKQMGMNYYPLMALLPNGEVLWFVERAGAITNGTYPFNKLAELPPLPPDFPFITQWPFTAGISMHAWRPDSDGAYRTFAFTIFGGTMKTAQSFTPAANVSATLVGRYCAESYICFEPWRVELMPEPRILGDPIVLPNERILVHGGATTGRGGSGGTYADNGAPRSFVFDPTKTTAQQRWALTAPILFLRVYHHTACLDVSGKILSAGCDACNVKLPTGYEGLIDMPGSANDFRLSMGTPREIFEVPRPEITAFPETIYVGSSFTVTVSYPGATVTGVVLATPCARTHMIGMDSRVVVLRYELATETPNTVTAHMPPAQQHGVLLPGHYMLFVLGDEADIGGRTYSTGRWVRVVAQQQLPSA